MKKTITLIILFIANCSLLIVNAQSIYFNKRIDITGDWDVCRGIVHFNNGYLVAGGHGPGEKIYLSYLDSVGKKKWYKTYTQTGYNYFFGLSGSLFQTKDNYFAICGCRAQYYGFGILIKVDSLGNKKWEREYHFLRNTVVNSGAVTKDSGFILTGDADTISPRLKYLLIKTDSLGNQQWYKTFTDNDPNRNYAGKCVIETSDTGYCIGGGGGYYQTAVDYRSIVEIIKTDKLGNQQWKKTYGNPIYNNHGGFITQSKDTCIVFTYSSAYEAGEYANRQVFISKIDMDGNEKWNKRIGLFVPGNYSSWIHTLADGSFVISGGHEIKDTLGKWIGWLFKLNTNGDSLWYKEYTVINGPNDANQLWHFTPTSDKGFAAAGSLFPNSAGGTQDIWVFKTDSLGCLVYNCTGLGVTEFNPNAGAQMLVYPNPFKEAFAINYNIPKESKKGVFELRDVMGRLVYSTPLYTNINQLQVVASSLKAGLYVATFIIDGVVVCSQKIIKE